jgi:hypothetical protein
MNGEEWVDEEGEEVVVFPWSTRHRLCYSSLRSRLLSII